jgi:hypothetical protein
MDDVFDIEIFRVLEKMIAEKIHKNYDYLVFVFKQVKKNKVTCFICLRIRTSIARIEAPSKDTE